jgi:hypothetical protein
MEKLSPGASGLRHLRWSREILASLEAHYEHNPLLVTPDRDLILEEAVKIRALVIALSGAVKPYRDFLERRRTQFRGMLRVGVHLCVTARARAEKALLVHGAEGLLAPDRTRRSHGHDAGPEDLAQATREAAVAMRSIARSLPELAQHADDLADAAVILEGFREAFENLESRERAPLQAALGAAKSALLQGLAELDVRLEKRLGKGFVDSLYPALTRGASIVADAGDEDDDAAAAAIA